MTSKPKILIDARMVSPVEHGISRYVTSIAEALEDIGLGNLRYEPIFILNREMSSLGRSPWSRLKTVTANSEFLSVAELVEIPKMAIEIQASAFHSPSFASFPSLNVPFMQTVHDLIHLKHGNLLHKIYYRYLLKPFAKKANILASVSLSAAGDLSDWLSYDLNKILILRNTFTAVDSTEKSLAAERDLIARASLKSNEFYLVIANNKPHKNLKLLQLAHRISGSKIQLVVAHEFMEQFDPGRNSTFALPALLRNARAILSPSLVEGFGRVPVESILFRTPVIISDIPSHREIFEGSDQTGLTLLNPQSLDDWVNAFKKFENCEPEKPSVKIVDFLLAKYSLRDFGFAIDTAYNDLIK